MTPRFLHIYLDNGLTHRHMSIVDSDKTTKLYTVSGNSGSMFSSKPHMRITRAGDAKEVGTVTFHSFSATELVIHGRALTLERAGLITRTRNFRSVSAGILTWKHESVFGSSVTLFNGRNRWLARFDRSMFSIGKQGKLELAGPEVRGDLLEEVIVTGLAMVEETRRAEKSSASSAS